MELFQTHVDNIISIGTSYPPHEVIYEQTIVTPAVTHIAEMAKCNFNNHKRKFLKNWHFFSNRDILFLNRKHH